MFAAFVTTWFITARLVATEILLALLRLFVLLRGLAAFVGLDGSGLAVIKRFFAEFALAGIFRAALVFAALVFVRLGMRRAETVVASKRAFLVHLFRIRIFLAIVAGRNRRGLIVALLRALRLVLVGRTTTVVKTVAPPATTTS